MEPLTNSIRPDVPPHDQHNGSMGALNATPAPGGETTPVGTVMTVETTDPPPAAPTRRRPWLFPLAGVVFAAAAVGVWFAIAGAGAHADVNNAPGGPGAPAAARKGTTGLTVSTITPRKKVLERKVTLPVSIKPAAQAELYARLSGYLKSIQKEATGDGREKDIGSAVRAGDCLMEIDAPEQTQDVVEKDSILKQRTAELEAAKTGIATYEASLEAAKAQRLQAEADVQKYKHEHTYRLKQLARVQSLVRDRTITEDVLDEKQYQTNAAHSAWEASRARLETVQAELSVISSKLATARADLHVKEALVRVARDGLRRAELLAEFAKVRAPFDGIITYRGVDVGDLVQNSSTGQTRLLMTVSSIDRLRLVAQVPERDAPWARVGTEGLVHDVDALEGWEAKVRIARTTKSLDAGSRTLHVEMDLDNKDHRLLPGMYGQLTLVLQKIADAYAVPATAVYSRKGTNYLLLVNDGVARHQPVRIRYDDGREVEVVKLVGGAEVALDGSERIIVSNKGEIGDGQPVVTAK